MTSMRSSNGPGMVSTEGGRREGGLRKVEEREYWISCSESGHGREAGREGRRRTYQVGCAYEKDLGHVHRHIQIMVNETFVLIRIQQLQKGRGGVSSIPS